MNDFRSFLLFQKKLREQYPEDMVKNHKQNLNKINTEIKNLVKETKKGEF